MTNGSVCNSFLFTCVYVRPLLQACKDFGFFYLENHGVPEEVMRYVFDQSKAFFSLDIKEKMKVKADKNNHGYTPMHEEIVDPEHQSKGDTKVECLPARLFLSFFVLKYFTRVKNTVVTTLSSWSRSRRPRVSQSPKLFCRWR